MFYRNLYPSDLIGIIESERNMLLSEFGILTKENSNIPDLHALLGEFGVKVEWSRQEEKGEERRMKKLDWKLFGARLRSRREALGYTQQDVESNTGMSLTYFGNWERGIKTPGVLENFFKVCVFFQADPSYFLGLADIPDNTTPAYLPRKYPESSTVADLVDQMPESSRKKVLAIAKMEAETMAEYESVSNAKNKKIEKMLERLLGAVSDGSSVESVIDSIND